MQNWIPNRKALAGGFIGVISFFLMRFFDMEEAIAAQISSFLIVAAHYLTPDSISDTLRAVNKFVKKLGSDPESQHAEEVLRKKGTGDGNIKTGA